MEFKYTSNWDQLNKKLRSLHHKAKTKGKKIVVDAAEKMEQTTREHLENQGRGGAPPPLSRMTRQIYRVDGEPDGSGIRNHLTIEVSETPNQTIAILGIPEGRPSEVARIQDQGTTYPVTDEMRGFLAARYGIFLSPKTTHITVPGRKFWEESLRKVRSQTLQEFSRFFLGF